MHITSIRKSFCTVVIVSSFTLGLIGCDHSANATSLPAQELEPSDEMQVVNTPRFTVIGIDCSGSYTSMIDQGLRIASELVRLSEPGDEILVRWISDRSYQSDQAVAHIKIPPEPQSQPRPVSDGNRFDQRARRQLAIWQAQEAYRQSSFRSQLEKLKTHEVSRLQALPRPVANHTDIYGFIAAAGDAFRERRQSGSELHLVLVTDLKDTVQRDIGVPDMGGVSVAIWGVLTDSDPKVAYRLREEWQQFFLEKGLAASVDVRSANLLPQ